LNSFFFFSKKTIELIPLYSKIKPVDSSLEYSLPSGDGSSPLTTSGGEDEFDFPSTLVVFTETKILDFTNRFRRDADAYYVEAKRSTVSSVAQVPYWMYGLLVLLGWNEAMAVLFNPLYFAFLLTAVGSA
jgi:protein SEY1